MVVAIGGALEFKGRWFARYKEDGKRKQVYGQNAEDVLIKRQELIDKLNKPFKESIKSIDENADSRIIENADEYDVSLSNNNVTLGNWLTGWLETNIKPYKSLSTYKGYKVFVTNHIIPSMGDVKLKDLTPDLMQVFFNTKASRSYGRAVESGRCRKVSTGFPQNEDHESENCDRPREQGSSDGGMSPQSISNMQFMLKSSLEIAVADKIIPFNPMDLISITRATRKEKRVLTHEEERKLIEACNSSEKIIMYGVVIALRLGLDVGELLALKWIDIDSELNQVCVHRIIKRESSTDETSPIKTSLLPEETDSVRIIQNPILNDDFIAETNLLKDKYISSIGFVPETVIANSSGLPIDPSYYSRLYKKVLDSAGIPKANFDILKNTFVVRLFEMGLDSSEIQNIVGYSEGSRPLKRLKDIARNKAPNE